MSDEQPQLTESKKALTAMQRMWLAHYVQSWNATEAARKAGYKDPEQSGWANKRKVEIQAEIEQHLHEIMPRGEILERFAAEARFDFGDLLIVTEEEVITERTTKGPDGTVTTETTTVKRPVVRLDLKRAKDEGLTRFIKSYSMTQRGERLEVYDAQAAKTQLGKFHGMWTDRTVNTTLEIDFSKLSDEQVQRIANGEDPAQVVKS